MTPLYELYITEFYKLKCWIIRETSERWLMEMIKIFLFFKQNWEEFTIWKIFLLKIKFIVYLSTWIERGLFPFTDEISAVQEPLSTKEMQHVESVDGEEQGQRLRPYEEQEKNAHEKARQQRAPDKAGSGKKYKPCLRWKNLELVFSHVYVIIPLMKYWCLSGIWWWGILYEKTKLCLATYTLYICPPYA